MAFQAQQKLDRVRVLELQAIISAIHSVASAIVNPEEVKFTDANSAMDSLRAILFPVLEIEKKARDKKAAALIEQESRRPMQMIIPQTESKGLVPRKR